MKKLSFIFFLISIVSGCKNGSENALSQDCKDMKLAFSNATQGYYVNCMKACFKVTGTYLTNSEMKEKLRDSCDIACRGTIPHSDLNKVKSFLDSKYNCGFDYSQTLGNPLVVDKAE